MRGLANKVHLLCFQVDEMILHNDAYAKDVYLRSFLDGCHLSF